MKKLKKLFGEFNMSWVFLIIFAIASGIIPAVLKKIPALNGTSFQDIAINLDMWIILAIFVIVNTKSMVEAATKCFVYFLISQPLIYTVEALIETVFHNGDFMKILKLYIENYYIGAHWAHYTVLTIPGAIICYQIKKNNILATLILSVATVYLSFFGTKQIFESVTRHFPYHFINGLICLIFAFLLVFVILESKKLRIVATVLNICGIAASLVIGYIVATSDPMQGNEIVDLPNEAKAKSISSENENVAYAEVSEADANDIYIYTGPEIGETVITITDTNGNEYKYDVKLTCYDFEIELEN